MLDFTNLRFLGVSCCTSERVGQDHIVTCSQLHTQYIWSPTEQGTYAAAVEEHSADHLAAHHRECQQREHALAVNAARWAYRNTEPGHPARRAIHGYEAYLY